MEFGFVVLALQHLPPQLNWSSFANLISVGVKWYIGTDKVDMFFSSRSMFPKVGRVYNCARWAMCLLPVQQKNVHQKFFISKHLQGFLVVFWLWCQFLLAMGIGAGEPKNSVFCWDFLKGWKWSSNAMQVQTFEVALQRDDLIKLSQGLSQTLRAQTGPNEAQQHPEPKFGSFQRSSPKRDFKGESRCWL